MVRNIRSRLVGIAGCAILLLSSLVLVPVSAHAVEKSGGVTKSVRSAPAQKVINPQRDIPTSIKSPVRSAKRISLAQAKRRLNEAGAKSARAFDNRGGVVRVTVPGRFAGRTMSRELIRDGQWFRLRNVQTDAGEGCEGSHLEDYVGAASDTFGNYASGDVYVPLGDADKGVLAYSLCYAGLDLPANYGELSQNRFVIANDATSSDRQAVRQALEACPTYEVAAENVTVDGQGAWDFARGLPTAEGIINNGIAEQERITSGPLQAISRQHANGWQSVFIITSDNDLMGFDIDRSGRLRYASNEYDTISYRFTPGKGQVTPPSQDSVTTVAQIGSAMELAAPSYDEQARLKGRQRTC